MNTILLFTTTSGRNNYTSISRENNISFYELYTSENESEVENISLVDEDHNIDCKIDGFGKMGLKSEFVKKI